MGLIDVFDVFSIIAVSLRRTIVLAVAMTLPSCSLFPSSQRPPRDDSANAASWNRNEVSRRSRETIGLGVDFLPVTAESIASDFWRQVDETAFEPKVRAAWRANGLRIGIVRDPSALPRPDSVTDPAEALMIATGVSTNGPSGHDSVMITPSRRHELPLGPITEGTSAVLLRTPTGLVGRTVSSPQGLLSIEATWGPGERQASLRLLPQIQHGESQPRFISGDAALRLASGRPTWSMDDMQLDWTTREGDRLVIAPDFGADDRQAVGLGRSWFHRQDKFTGDGFVMLVLHVEAIPDSAAAR